MDIFIKRELKNWSTRHQPPTNGKARLLMVANLDCGPSEAHHPKVRFKERPSWLSMDLRVENPGEPINHAWLWIMHLALNPIRYVA